LSGLNSAADFILNAVPAVSRASCFDSGRNCDYHACPTKDDPAGGEVLNNFVMSRSSSTGIIMAGANRADRKLPGFSIFVRRGRRDLG